MLRGTVAAALVCVLAGVAHADNKEAAKEAYSEGKRHYDLGEYDAALTAFKKAYLNYEEPVFLFNIAQCYRALGDRPAAVRTYRAFLRNWPKAPNREQVERIIAELDQPSETAPPPTATATAPPARPETKPAATTPAAPPPASAGTAAPAPGRPATAPSTAVASSEHPSPPPPPAATSEPKPAPTAKPAPPKHDDLVGMVEVEPNFDRPSGSTKPVKWWAWTLIAVAVGGVVAASVAIGVTQSSAKFDNTLPQFNVNNSALQAATVRF